MNCPKAYLWSAGESSAIVDSPHTAKVGEIWKEMHLRMLKSSSRGNISFEKTAITMTLTPSFALR